MRRAASFLGMVGAIAIVAGACGGESNNSPTGGTGGAGNGTGTGTGAGMTADDLLPCDVSDMLAMRCQQCHSAEPKFGAPMPLVTRGDLLSDSLQGNTVAEECLARMASDDRMPPPPNEAATPAEIAVLQGWLDAGTPARADGEMCGAGGGGGTGGGATCTPDTTIVGQQPFEMPAASMDEQICFGITIPASADKRHITGILPSIDNDTILHHILLLQSPTPVSPDPEPCGFTNLDWKLLYAWGPGTPPHILPAEAGFPMEAGQDQHFVLQVHYNNLQGLVGEMDQSGVELCTTTDLRPNDADIMAFGSINFSGIVPMATSTLDCAVPLPALVDPYFPVTIFQSWPHMHQIGAAMTSVIEHGDGSTTELANVPDYDFNYQITYENDAQLDVGDTLRTVCTWDNNTANDVGFGEDTADEMCFNFVSYYPRIDAPVWSWLAPSQLASCNMSVQ